MATTLIAVIFALVLGHLAPGFAASVRRHEGFGLWLHWLDARFGDGPSVWRGHYGFLFALLPPLLLVGLIQFALHTPLAGVFGPAVRGGGAVLRLGSARSRRRCVCRRRCRKPRRAPRGGGKAGREPR